MPLVDNSAAPLEADDARFLKYMSCATGKIVLQNRTLRWATPGTLNDPYDAQFDLHIDVDRQQLRAITLGKIWDAYAGEQPPPIRNALSIALHPYGKTCRGFPGKTLNDSLATSLSKGLNAANATCLNCKQT